MAGAGLTEQQIRSLAEAAWKLRWRIAEDMNGDGALTVSDVLAWCQWVFFAPGDYLLLVTMSNWTPVAAFFEMDHSMLSGWASGLLSVFSVLALVRSIMLAIDAAKHFFRAFAMRWKRESQT
jgi:hypothetical protein